MKALGLFIVKKIVVSPRHKTYCHETSLHRWRYVRC